MLLFVLVSQKSADDGSLLARSGTTKRVPLPSRRRSKIPSALRTSCTMLHLQPYRLQNATLSESGRTSSADCASTSLPMMTCRIAPVGHACTRYRACHYESRWHIVCLQALIINLNCLCDIPDLAANINYLQAALCCLLDKRVIYCH